MPESRFLVAMYFYSFFACIISIGFVGVFARSFFQFPGTVNNLRIQRSYWNFKGVDSHTLNESVENAVWSAFKNCRLQTKWERWNCPEHDFLKHTKMLITKEQAFMESITVASIMYTLFVDCFQGKFHQCRCFKESRTCDPYCIQKFNMKSLVQFGVKVINTYLNHKTVDSLRMHNRRVGIQVVKKSLRWIDMCKSNVQITPFSDIAELLKIYWKTSTKLDINMPWFSKSGLAKRYLKNTLVYIEESPNYCRRNDKSIDIQGTEGRVCLTKNLSLAHLKPEHTEACHRLCFSCGYFVNKKLIKTEQPCRCRMNGCCNMQCDTCIVHTVSYYCQQ